MSIVAVVWPYIDRSLESLVLVLEQLDETGRTWLPPAEDANSIATLVNHTISNVGDNLIGTIAGKAVTYDRQADFDVPTADPVAVRERWESIRGRFEACLPELSDPSMFEIVPHPRRGDVVRMDVLTVVARHAAEHLAHAELTRDLYRAAR